MILLIDNYDSFVYNLFQYAGQFDREIRVTRNDALSIAMIKAMNPDHILLSPGPGRPKDAGLCEAVVRQFSGKIPILGICLGHQAICEAFGATIGYAQTLMHGKPSDIHLDKHCPIFADLPQTIQCGRYHSLSVIPDSLPAELSVVARSSDDEIMGVQHVRYPVYGLQFHPESILTPTGKTLLRNFLIGGKKHD